MPPMSLSDRFLHSYVLALKANALLLGSLNWASCFQFANMTFGGQSVCTRAETIVLYTNRLIHALKT